jgi:hypothetical protein
MPAALEASIEFVDQVASLRLPPKADQRLQELMDCSESLALVRAHALRLLGQRPL